MIKQRVLSYKHSKVDTQPHNLERGFTLLEIIVVMVILSVLAAIVAPKFIGRTEDARITEAKVQIRNFETSLKLYKIDSGFYPSSEQGLEALISVPAVGRIPKNYRSGGYLDSRAVPQDPWGTSYIYLSPGSSGDYEIISLGSDGLEGGDGGAADIKSWDL